jgi:hypothetical protein
METKEMKAIVGTYQEVCMIKQHNHTTHYYDGGLILFDGEQDMNGNDVAYAKRDIAMKIKILNGTTLKVEGFSGRYGVLCCASVARVYIHEAGGWMLERDVMVMLHGRNVILNNEGGA